jgi:hypothetical protein
MNRPPHAVALVLTLSFALALSAPLACSGDDASPSSPASVAAGGSPGSSSSAGTSGAAGSAGTSAAPPAGTGTGTASPTTTPPAPPAPGDPGDPTTPTPPTSGAASACKRGIAYGYHSQADMQALRPGVSWWYNWAFSPDKDVVNTFAAEGFSYVPMVWGTKVDLASVNTSLLPGAPALLGFNEPNFFSQANLSASDAAKAWPGVQAIADAHGLPLISPAVNFCGGGCHDTDPFAYLDAFFAACPGCRVDAIAVHVYVGCKGEGGQRAKWLENHLKTYEARFSQPIWLTEFACDDAATPDDAVGFLEDAVGILENDPRVARYAWFSGRTKEIKNVDLLGQDGQLTPLGKAYVEAPRNAACLAEKGL